MLHIRTFLWINFLVYKIIKGNDEYERKKICTLKKSSYAAYKNILWINLLIYKIMKGNDEYERKKICEIKS